MREIKFRLWDKEEKRMIYLDKVSDPMHHNFLINEKGTIEYYNLQNGSGGTEYVIMQYTGIKDERGTEIYEGDIVLYDYVMIGEVYYDETETSYILKPLNKASSYEVLGLSTPLRVIGNVFENPELLEGE